MHDMVHYIVHYTAVLQVLVSKIVSNLKHRSACSEVTEKTLQLFSDLAGGYCRRLVYMHMRICACAYVQICMHIHTCYCSGKLLLKLENVPFT